MSQEVHGHEVLNMMAESGKSYSRESLKNDIQAKFGKEARFFTCSAQGMSADELIDFLGARGKFFAKDNGFATDASKICSHEGPHDHD